MERRAVIKEGILEEVAKDGAGCTAAGVAAQLFSGERYFLMWGPGVATAVGRAKSWACISNLSDEWASLKTIKFFQTLSSDLNAP